MYRARILIEVFSLTHCGSGAMAEWKENVLDEEKLKKKLFLK